MFSIDLLKGKGRPSKSRLKRTMLKTVPFLIPLIAIVAWASSYQQDCNRIRDQKALIQKNQALIDDASQTVGAYRRMNAQITGMNKCLQAIAKGLSYRIQLTDLLVELTQTLPNDIFIDEVNLVRTAEMRKPTQQNKDGEKHLVVLRKLKLTLCGFDPVQSDRWVREYISLLKNSDVLADIFVDVKSAARRQGLVDNRPATYYEIECLVREQG